MRFSAVEYRQAVLMPLVVSDRAPIVRYIMALWAVEVREDC